MLRFMQLDSFVVEVGRIPRQLDLLDAQLLAQLDGSVVEVG